MVGSVTISPESLKRIQSHALAERFGLFDRFFVNAEVSSQGHNWSTAAYSPDYVEKTIPSNYSDRGRTYDYEGENRGTVPDDDVNGPGTGYLWDAAARAGVTLRNYGEFARHDRSGRWVATKASLAPCTCPVLSGLGPRHPRPDGGSMRGSRSSGAFEAADSLPQLTILRLPSDHTAGTRVGAPTPLSYVADNDLALGRVIEALSRSPVLEEHGRCSSSRTTRRTGRTTWTRTARCCS